MIGNIPFRPGPAFINFHPKFSGTLLVSSTSGICTLQDVKGTSFSTLYQVGQLKHCSLQLMRCCSHCDCTVRLLVVTSIITATYTQLSRCARQQCHGTVRSSMCLSLAERDACTAYARGLPGSPEQTACTNLRVPCPTKFDDQNTIHGTPSLCLLKARADACCRLTPRGMPSLVPACRLLES